ncbi:hypothetical protein CC2G_009353 [Coprinopsis cinerea AmutBmut pab1-1]|nr:hypothetical protein CC2G_009353 [Coprinopsis cinerea AmutBmut pab1-1]
MHPSQDPTVTQRILEHHPYPFDFSKSPIHKLAGRVSTREASGCSILPPELWAEVFLNCIPQLPAEGTPTPWYHRDLYVNPLTPPLLLCQICRSWRQIALSLSQLWQSLTVYVSMGTAYPSVELSRLWISRSGNLPLSLALYQQNESNLNRLVAGRMLGLFMKYIPRWCEIDLHLAGPRLPYSLAPEELRAPSLRRFNMKTSYRVYEKEEKCIFGIFEDVPRLSHLQVSRIPELDLLGNSAVNIPFAQLESLSLDYVPSVGTSLHLLNKCNNIRDCTLKIDSLFGPIEDIPLFHPSLRSLSINISHEHFPGFLARITLPALKRLKIHVRGPLEQYTWPQHSFEEFLERSSCELTRFEIHDSGMRVDQFVSVLCQKRMQGLEELVVDDRRDWTWDPFVTDIALDLLNSPRYKDAYSAIVFLNPNVGSITTTTTTSEGEGWLSGSTACFLPNLAQLVLRGNCLRTSDGAIADMVESRWYERGGPGVKQLKNVKLDIPSSHLADVQRLKALQAKGLGLELSFLEET